MKVRGYDVYNSRSLADNIGQGRNNLLLLLRKKGILTHDNLPANDYKKKGWFVVGDTVHNGFHNPTTYFTEAGRDAIEKLVIETLGPYRRKVKKLKDLGMEELSPGLVHALESDDWLVKMQKRPTKIKPLT